MSTYYLLLRNLLENSIRNVRPRGHVSLELATPASGTGLVVTVRLPFTSARAEARPAA